jgi:predicted dehydrogenase
VSTRRDSHQRLLPRSTDVHSTSRHHSNPYIVALKSALDSGKLGTILGVQGAWAVRKGPSEYYQGWHGVRSEGGGTVSINMIHDVDLLRHLMGDVESVFCLEGNRTRGLDVEETGGVVMRFKSGAVGTFFFSEWVVWRSPDTQGGRCKLTDWFLVHLSQRCCLTVSLNQDLRGFEHLRINQRRSQTASASKEPPERTQVGFTLRVPFRTLGDL